MEKKEYIDREAALRAVKSVSDGDYAVYAAAYAITQLPAADVVEVVHGEWIWNEDCECWVCSVCELSALNNYRGLSVNSECCPHCGAKMDGGNRNADA